MKVKRKVVAPQPGYQTKALSSPADFVVGGGAAGTGKTWTLLVDPLRYIHMPEFRGIIFRRKTTELISPGGILDAAEELYRDYGGELNKTTRTFMWPSGAKIKLDHMQLEKDRYSHKGAEYAYIGFDELTSFTEGQVDYLASRNRTIAPMRPVMRSTTNPEPGWVCDMLLESGFVDPDTGLAVQENSGRVKWYYRINGQRDWDWDRDKLMARHDDYRDPDGNQFLPKSFSFIPGSLYENRILLSANPEYAATLNSLNKVDRDRLLGGNWLVRESKGLLFQDAWWKVIEHAPPYFDRLVRYWDNSATVTDRSDYTASVLMGVKDFSGVEYHMPLDGAAANFVNNSPSGVYVLDVQRGRWTPEQRLQKMAQTMEFDARMYNGRVEQWVEQEPGGAGKDATWLMTQSLMRYGLRPDLARTDKITKAKPYSAAVERGFVFLVQGPWNSIFMQEHAAFPDKEWHDDQVDAASGAFNKVVSNSGGGVTSSYGAILSK